MENKEKAVMSLGAEFEVLDAPASAASSAANPAPPAAASVGGAMPLRKSVATASLGLLMALGGLLGAHPARFAAVQAAIAAYLVYELLRAGLLRAQATARPIGPIPGALAVVGGALAFLGGDGAPALVAPILAILGGLTVLAAPTLSKKDDAKLPPAPAEQAVDAQFSKLLLGNLLILASVTSPWTTAARGADTIVGALLLVCCALAIAASWIGMSRSWAMPAVSGGKLGMMLIITPLEGLTLGAFGIVRLFKTGSSEDGIMNPSDWWPGEVDLLTHGVPIFLILGASAWSLMTVVQGTMKGVEAQKKRKEDEIAARKAARASASGASGASASAEQPKA